jgi:hypothetical protein
MQNGQKTHGITYLRQTYAKQKYIIIIKIKMHIDLEIFFYKKKII